MSPPSIDNPEPQTLRCPSEPVPGFCEVNNDPDCSIDYYRNGKVFRENLDCRELSVFERRKYITWWAREERILIFEDIPRTLTHIGFNSSIFINRIHELAGAFTVETFDENGNDLSDISDCLNMAVRFTSDNEESDSWITCDTVGRGSSGDQPYGVRIVFPKHEERIRVTFMVKFLRAYDRIL